MKRRIRAAFIGCCTAVVPAAGTGAEIRAQASVVDVVPLGAGSEIEACPARPPGQDLAALLAWDLRLHCAAGKPPSGYRVYYRWDGRTYSRIMDRHPGDSVAVRVRLD